MTEEGSLKKRIAEALDSPKFSPRLQHGYRFFLQDYSEEELMGMDAYFLARGKSGLDFEGRMGEISGIYAIKIPYVRLPELIAKAELHYFDI